jgi:hypothetical protein
MIARKRQRIPLCQRCHDDRHHNRPKLQRQGNESAVCNDKVQARFGGGPGAQAALTSLAVSPTKTRALTVHTTTGMASSICLSCVPC